MKLPLIVKFAEPFNREILERPKDGYYDYKAKVWKTGEGKILVKTKAEKIVRYGCSGTLADREW